MMFLCGLVIGCGCWSSSDSVVIDTSDSAPVVDWDGDGFPEEDDCDDADPWVNPGAPERCDGIDNDCDGGVDEVCPPAPVGDLDLADSFASVVGLDGGAIGYSVAVGDDLTGDGRPDALVAVGSGGGGTGLGFVVEGPVAGVVPTSSAAGVFEGIDTYPYLGNQMRMVGDLGVDGLADVAFVTEDGVAVYVGPFSGSYGPNDAVATLLGMGPVGGAGQIAGDGQRTLVVSQPDRNYTGAAPAVLGGAIFAYSSPEGELGADDAVGSVEGAIGYGQLGRELCFVGDLDGDGIEQVAATVGDVAQGLYLHYGALSMSGHVVSESDVSLADRSKGTDSGSLRVAGQQDLDQDGLSDFVVGAYDGGLGHGVAYVFTEAPVAGMTAATGTTFLDADRRIEFDSASVVVPAFTDLDGDGRVDVAVGVPDMADGDSAVYVFYGPLSGVATQADADAVLWGVGQGSRSGSSLAGGFDFTGDFYPDLLIGAPFEVGSGDYAGVVWVVAGGP